MKQKYIFFFISKDTWLVRTASQHQCRLAFGGLWDGTWYVAASRRLYEQTGWKMWWDRVCVCAASNKLITLPLINLCPSVVATKRGSLSFLGAISYFFLRLRFTCDSSPSESALSPWPPLSLACVAAATLDRSPSSSHLVAMLNLLSTLSLGRLLSPPLTDCNWKVQKSLVYFFSFHTSLDIFTQWTPPIISGLTHQELSEQWTLPVSVCGEVFVVFRIKARGCWGYKMSATMWLNLNN